MALVLHNCQASAVHNVRGLLVSALSCLTLVIELTSVCALCRYFRVSAHPLHAASG